MEASLAWKNTSGFWALPRRVGASGVSARRRWASIHAGSTRASSWPRESSRTLATSCEVRKPSKKCSTGTRDPSASVCETAARSWASCTPELDSIVQPVMRAAMTSLWSPKIDSAWVATVRAATWITAGLSSPAILNMSGSMSSRPCEAVNVVARAPRVTAPCTAPAAPASLCISTTVGTLPSRLGTPAPAHWSACSLMAEAGVIG